MFAATITGVEILLWSSLQAPPPELAAGESNLRCQSIPTHLSVNRRIDKLGSSIIFVLRLQAKVDLTTEVPTHDGISCAT